MRAWWAGIGAVSLVALLCAPASAADDVAERARSGVADVLSRPEFQPLADADGLLSLPRVDLPWYEDLIAVLMDLLEEFAKLFLPALKGILNAIAWLLRGLGGLFGAGGAAGAATAVSPVLLTILAAIVVGLIAWLVFRLFRSARQERATRRAALDVAVDVAHEHDALTRTPEDWRRRAERLAAAGHRVEALRALYLELLAALHRLGAIDYDRSRTNTAYVRDVSRGHAARGPFLALTTRFDRAVYGAHHPTHTDLAEAARDVDLVRSAFAPEAARA